MLHGLRQGSTLSDHRMTTGFGPFELQTCGLLQRGRDHSPPKACFDLRNPALGWPSKCYEYTVAKQNGGVGEWVELFITRTRGMGKPTYELLPPLVLWVSLITVSEPHICNLTVSEPYICNCEPHICNLTVSEPHICNLCVSLISVTCVWASYL